MGDVEELERALNYPWERWINFLHPSQKQLVEAQYSGPARVSGSAGIGKTVVALHRAVFLAKRNPEARVLLATFSEPLANALRSNLKRLISNEPRLGERIEVHALNSIGQRLYECLAAWTSHRIDLRDLPTTVQQAQIRNLSGPLVLLESLPLDWPNAPVQLNGNQTFLN